eukprot:11154941-Lingulodinium_polyedra.AAC.1
MEPNHRRGLAHNVGLRKKHMKPPRSRRGWARRFLQTWCLRGAMATMSPCPLPRTRLHLFVRQYCASAVR